MRASSGPNADVSDRTQVRGMGDVVDGERFERISATPSVTHRTSQSESANRARTYSPRTVPGGVHAVFKVPMRSMVPADCV